MEKNRYSLYDILVGYFASEVDHPAKLTTENYFEKYSSDLELLKQSILENLRMILQTRRNSDSHLPDFGLPDILRIYMRSGGTSKPIKEKIQETIEQYEPRIEGLTIHDPIIDKKNLRIELKIEANIKGVSSPEVLITEFSLTGWTKIYRVDQ